MPRTAVPVTTASEYPRARDDRRRDALLYGRWGSELSDDWGSDDWGRDRARSRRAAAEARQATADAAAPRERSAGPARTSRAADRDRAERPSRPRSRPRTQARTEAPPRRSVSAAQAEATQALTQPPPAGPELTLPVDGHWDYVAEPPAERDESGRRTVTIAGRGAEAYVDRRGTRPSTAQRHQAVRRHEREGFRPDRVAMWAVALGVILMLAAAASSHAAVLAVHHALAH